MGSKTPETDGYGGHGDSKHSAESNQTNGEPRGSHMSRDGDGCIGDTGDGEDDDDGEDDQGEIALKAAATSTPATNLEATKKRKKPKKKKSKKKGAIQLHAKQTSPPRIPLSDLFPSGDFPQGEIQSYNLADGNTPRITAAESRANGKINGDDDAFLQNYRKAGEVHRQARRWLRDSVKPGDTLLDIAEGLENSVRAMLGHSGLEPGDSLKAGMGFPTGLCLNHQVAHYTPNPGQKDVVLQHQDVLTVDFGVHINGWIVDSAFTMAFDPTYDGLLAAVKDATNSGIETAGVDVRISDVSAAIQETMESHEVEIRGRTYPVKPIRNLTAHNIKQWRIHGGKSIPFVKNSDQTKMDEGEVFAIETFGSTGKGYTVDDIGVYGYGLNHNRPLNIPAPMSSAKRLHKTIRENFGTIVFCRRYLERLGVERYLAGMNYLVANDIVEQYGTLMDVKGSYSAQFEHTFLLGETHKEVLSRGDDY